MPIINQVVSGGGSGPAHYIEKSVDANGKLVNGNTMIDLTGVTDIGDYVLQSAYKGVQFPNNTTITFSNLTTISGAQACGNMFQNTTGISSVALPSLTTISGSQACSNMFATASINNPISFSLPSLTTISGAQACQSMFAFCGATTFDLSSLTTISGFNAGETMFGYNSHLTSVNVNSLTNLTGNGACARMFISCTALSSLSFPALTSTSFGTYTNQFTGMLQGVTGCTVHFPSNLQSVIGSWSDVTAGFGGTNTTVLFDLPATE